MLKCGFYERCITPPLGSKMQGYFIPRPCEGVKDELFTRAVVLSDGKCTSAIAYLDIESLPEGDFCDRVRDRVAEYSPSIRRESIILTASHSHTSGPNYHDGGLDSLYINMMAVNVADAIVIAEQRMEEMTAKYSVTNVEGISFVRNYRLADGTICTNPGYDADIVEPYTKTNTSLPTLFFYDVSGKIKGVITNYALHHDTVGGRLCSADYSGVLSRKLKEQYGNDFVCVFLNGPCGDVSHIDRIGGPVKYDVPNHIRIGSKLAECLVASETDSKPVAGDTVLTAQKVINLKKRKIAPERLEEAREFVASGATVDDFDPGLPQSLEFRIATASSLVSRYGDGIESVDLPINALRVGDCAVYAIPCEVFTCFGNEIKAKSPTDKVFITELSGINSEAYIPPLELMEVESVYETSPISRSLEPEAGEKIVAAALDLSKKLFEE